MDTNNLLLKILETNNYRISTDTRKDVSRSVYFALKGDNFDGNTFIAQAFQKGAVAVVTEDNTQAGEHVYIVQSVLESLQKLSNEYRKLFNIPLIAIGGSNGKSTSKELLALVLKTKYKTHATVGSLNNHIGVPLSIFAMPRDTEIGVFEIGANHPQEHTNLLKILEPTHVVVTNNGLDHLEGFGTPEGGRKANKEIFDWVKLQGTPLAFVHKNHPDLMEDSQDIQRITYPDYELNTLSVTPRPVSLAFSYEDTPYTTHLIGDYNMENIELAVSIGNYFDVPLVSAFEAVASYEPTGRRSQFLQKNNNDFVVDCYNANPTSMQLSLESFFNSLAKHKGVILGDMLELGEYAEIEHKKTVEYVLSQTLAVRLFIGPLFKKALEGLEGQYTWFETSEDARVWFLEQDFKGHTFLLKGSRGVQVEKVLG